MSSKKRKGDSDDYVYLVCFTIDPPDSDKLYQWNIIHDDYTVKSLEKISRYTFHGGCCGQSQCYICVFGSLVLSWKKTIRIREREYGCRLNIMKGLTMNQFINIEKIKEIAEELMSLSSEDESYSSSSESSESDDAESEKDVL
jgi:hypothetical protein